MLCKALQSRGYKVVSDGTDNHMFLLDLSDKGLTGKEVALRLHELGITVNKNMVPNDTKSPFVTSGIRIGTNCVTTLGLNESHMVLLAKLIDNIINSNDDLHLVDFFVKTLCEEYKY